LTGPQTVPGMGGLEKVVLRSRDGAVAEVYLHGAHVTSWQPASDGEERLFLSERSEFRAGSAIRGGIPVIFPQFAAEGPLPRHGFARTAKWRLLTGNADAAAPADGAASATLELESSEATRAIWPAEFVATLALRVGGDRLSIALGVSNVGSRPFTFTSALHTYLRVDDIGQARIEGLHGIRYRVSSDPGVLRVDEDEVVRIAGEIDRVYVEAPRRLVVRDVARTTVLEAAGFPDVIVWNPGPERGAALSDMEPGGDGRMLCVEAGAVQMPIVVEPGARWEGRQTLIAAPYPDGSRDRGLAGRE
jgi:glucose-6-phosphate 1-epimerase